MRAAMIFPLVLLIRLYQITLSPFLGGQCRYHPTCSVYAIDALRDYGAIRGSIMAAKRIGRCNPIAKGGYDPVPVPPKPTTTDTPTEPSQ
ncbi:MAG: membrane protein insertion efficiency factor YidD [Phycisphaera sp.]|nr:MAG: membrane protein insertion efficiency factor YidD [Phycisphaera sp.]